MKNKLFYITGCWSDVVNNHLIEEHDSLNEAFEKIRAHNSRLISKGFLLNSINDTDSKFKAKNCYKLIKTLKSGKKIVRYVGVWEALTPHDRLVKTNKQHKMCF